MSISPYWHATCVVAGCLRLINYVANVFLGSTKHEDAIQICNHKRVCEWSQEIIHHPHEHCWSISQAKGHDQKLKKAFF